MPPPSGKETAERITVLANLWYRRPAGVILYPEADRSLLTSPPAEASRMLRDLAEYKSLCDGKRNEQEWWEPPPHTVIAGSGERDWQPVAEHENGFTQVLPVEELRSMATTPGAPSTCTVVYSTKT